MPPPLNQIRDEFEDRTKMSETREKRHQISLPVPLFSILLFLRIFWLTSYFPPQTTFVVARTPTKTLPACAYG